MAAIKHEQVILNQNGQAEFVVLPIARYQKMIDLLEDFGLGKAMLEAEKDQRLHKKDALLMLEDDAN
jgi:hypothetical protein